MSFTSFQREAPAHEISAPGIPYPAHVLIVDDHNANVVVASAVLDLCGCSYKVAHNGKAAFDMIRDEDFDLVLMDIRMPILDGISSTLCIREFERKTGRTPVPIIALTAYSFTTDREHCLAAGMDDYLCKPFDPEKFKDTIDRLNNREMNF